MRAAVSLLIAIVASSAPVRAGDVPPGVGLDADGVVHPAFEAAYRRAGGEPVLGLPADNGGGVQVHAWGPGRIQDFAGPQGRGAIMQADGGEAYVIRGGAWEAYLALGGGESPDLGYPTSDEASGRQELQGGTLLLEAGAWRFVAGGAPLVASDVPHGVGVDDAGGFHPAFVDAYRRAGGMRVLGVLTDNGGGPWVHGWGAGRVQDFSGPGGRGAIMQADGGLAHVLLGAAWEAYLALGGAESAMGYPLDDEAGGRQPLQGGALLLEEGRWRFVARRGSPVCGIDLGPRTSLGPEVLEVLDTTGAAWVRINFVRHADAADWFREYDGVVDALRRRGVSIYALINTEALGLDQRPLAYADDPGGRAYVEAFAAEAEAIVGHFRGRVQVYELVNEPNNWRSKDEPFARVHPTWMALLLQRTYERVKLDHAADPTWDVLLVSGAVLSHPGSDATDYLADVWIAGRRDHDWDVVRARCGQLPVDGVGYHIYVHEDDDARPDEVAPTYARHLDAVEAFLGAHDPEAGEKRVWLSEFGWRSSHPRAGEMVRAAFAALRQDPRVALSVHFGLQDFVIPHDDGSLQLENWGLLDLGGAPKPDMVGAVRQGMAP